MTKLPASLLIWTVLATPATAQTVDKFDLICTGTATTENTGANDIKDNPAFVIPGPMAYSVHLNVDLAANLFCENQCSKPEAIQSVTTDHVIFRDSKKVVRLSTLVIVSDRDGLAVSRIDGSFVRVWDEAGNRAEGKPYLTHTAKGTCAKAPFTSLPKPVF